MGFSVLHRSTGPTVFWSFLHSICRVYKLPILRSIAPSYLSVMNWDQNCVEDPWSEGFAFLSIVVVSWLVEKLAWEEASATVLARSAAMERKALSSLLAATCDAVVHLDADMSVVGPNPKLAAILLRPEAAIDGIDFKSLFPDDEAATLEQNLEQTTESARAGVCARMFRTSLRDADGNTIPIHAYDTIITDLHGSESHLIGISEILQEQGGRQLPDPPPSRSRLRNRGKRSDREDNETTGSTASSGDHPGSLDGRLPRPGPGTGADRQGRGSVDLPSELPGLRPSPATASSRLHRRSLNGAFSGSSGTGSGSLGSGGADNGSGGGHIDSTLLHFGDEGGIYGSTLLHPDMQVTSQMGMELNIMRTLMTWNFPTGKSCCSIHAGLSLLCRLTDKMRRETACMELPTASPLSQGPQCNACGILACQPMKGSRCCNFCEALFDDRRATTRCRL